MSTGGQLVGAIAARDADGLRRLFAEQVDFKALTPGRFWEAGTPAEVAEVIFGHWFEPDDRIDSVEHTDEGQVADTARVGYCLALSNRDGRHLVEQQAYYRETEGRIDYLRLVCSGFRPLSD